MARRPGRSHRPQDEEAFLEAYDPREFERPSVAVDVALLSVREGRLCVPLVQRSEHPEQGKWALPGGFVGIDESLDAAAARVLESKAGQTGVYVEQLYSFGDPDRDPRTRVISVAYYALVDSANLRDLGARDARLGNIEVPWGGETGGPVGVYDAAGNQMQLAFDHADILGMAVKRLRGKLNYTPIGFSFLPETFALRRLQDVHETILGALTNKDSFRRRMLASGQLEATGERESEVGHRPAELYRFRRRSAV